MKRSLFDGIKYKTIVELKKRNLLLESDWALGVKYEKRDTVCSAFFPSPQHLIIMSCMNLLLKVVFQFSCCNFASLGQVWPQIASWKGDSLN